MYSSWSAGACSYSAKEFLKLVCSYSAKELMKVAVGVSLCFFSAEKLEF